MMATKKPTQDAENLTPAQKGAITRAANKAKAAAEAAAAQAAVPVVEISDDDVYAKDESITNPVVRTNDEGDFLISVGPAGDVSTPNAETAAALAVQLPPVVENVIDTIDNVTSNETVQVTVSKVTPKIGAKAREIIYNIGIVLGFIGTVGPVITAYLQGDAALAAASVIGISLALSNGLAKLNLSKTADDLNKEKAAAS
jgi:hypothetical protein